MSRDLNRRNHYDVTGRVFIADPRVVCAEVSAILRERFPEVDLRPVERAFDVFTSLYAGDWPGHLGCETWYHDAQHSLDCALVLARLVDGHELDVAADQRLGARRAVLGVIAALFHDAGYIRRHSDDAWHGAEFTLYHVRRSGEFLAEFLPTIGFGDEAAMTEQLVHFTGYEVALDRIRVEHPIDRRLGFLLGTADILAQMSDRCYLEKCHDCLYPEFEICGLAGRPREEAPSPVYASPEDLVRKSPGFMDQIWAERMDGYFEGVYRHAETHFGGRNLYVESVEKRRRQLHEALGRDSLEGSLRRQVDCINAGPLRIIVGLDQADPGVVEAARPPAPRFAV
ncbi:MAG: hypothetical protein R3225_05545 [Halofilum sp. (in: g-proteobacteria)]|nr:hypothetical protein [Halofilum sp. (in: g-proteobacteria)]